LAAFAIQTMPKHWPNVVGSFVKIFEEASNMQVKGAKSVSHNAAHGK
jgi:hypothetical protein